MLYTALGDSITYGENASPKSRAYVPLAVSAANSQASRIISRTVARPGWTSEDLWRAVIRQGPAIARSDTVSVWIGGVDLAHAGIAAVQSGRPPAIRQALADYRRHFESILGHVRQTSSARIICFTQYNPFPHTPLAIQGIRELNRITTDVSRRYRASLAPAHLWFEGRQAELIYGYRQGRIEDALGGFLPIHPNNRGHEVIAAGLAPYLLSAR